MRENIRRKPGFSNCYTVKLRREKVALRVSILGRRLLALKYRTLKDGTLSDGGVILRVEDQGQLEDEDEERLETLLKERASFSHCRQTQPSSILLQ